MQNLKAKEQLLSLLKAKLHTNDVIVQYLTTLTKDYHLCLRCVVRFLYSNPLSYPDLFCLSISDLRVLIESIVDEMTLNKDVNTEIKEADTAIKEINTETKEANTETEDTNTVTIEVKITTIDDATENKKVSTTVTEANTATIEDNNTATKEGNDAVKEVTVIQLNEQINEAKDQPNVCPVCLGILQTLDVMTLNAIETLKNGVYEFSSFSLKINSPKSIFVRRHSISLVLMKKFQIDLSVYDKFAKKYLTINDFVLRYLSQQMENSLSKEYNENSTFTIFLNYDHPESRDELSFLFSLKENGLVRPKRTKAQRYNKIQPEITDASILKCLNGIADETFERVCFCPPKALSTFVQRPTLSFNCGSIFLAGRYNKYSRLLSQTPWFLGNVRKTETSLEEQITDHLKPLLKYDEVKFLSSGREDLDVRMLGTGRPFVLEIINPSKGSLSKEELLQLQQNVEKGQMAAVRDLQMVSKNDTSYIKDGEEEKQKTYSAVVWLSKDVDETALDKLNASSEFIINQKTPLRVMHRRAILNRERTIYSLNLKKIENTDNFAIMEIQTQAGTYIKEFVHSDLGRTHPSLCSLLDCECEILQLDVTAVKLDWPPRIDP